MNRYDCEATRDVLPSLVRGEMLQHEAAAAERHLDDCEDCRSEARIIRLLQDSLAPVPSGLEARVVLAVRRRSLTRRLPARLAMAATVAAAILGGAYVVERSGRAGLEEAAAVSWAAAEDPLLHGASDLHELTEEELELILEELDP